MSTLRPLDYLPPKTFRRALLLSGCLYFISMCALAALILHWKKDANCGGSGGPMTIPRVAAKTAKGAVTNNSFTPASTRVASTQPPSLSRAEQWQLQCVDGAAGTVPAPTHPGITQVAADCYTIATEFRLDAVPRVVLLANSGAVRAVPVVKNGITVGVKLYAIRPGTLFAGLGLRNGDTVSKVNGIAPVSLDAALAVDDDLQKSELVSLEVVRRGQPKTIMVRVE